MSANISSHSPSIDAVWGDSLDLFCNATGYPVPGFSWKFRGKSLSENVTKGITTSSSSVHLTKLHAISHGGEYRCEASNAAGSDSALFSVTCECYICNASVWSCLHCVLPSFVVKPKVLVLPMSVGVVYGSWLELTCTVASYPAVNSVVWYKNGQQIIDSSTAAVKKNQTATTNRYSVQNTTETACGDYSCYSGTSPTATVTGQ